ncbi:hypothetical protein V5O48_003839, partial [Marasmius crinis-equi]
ARFSIAMDGVKSVEPPDVALKAYDWKKLPPGSLVVDVGGGVGSATDTIVKSFPDLKFVVQDRPAVVEDAKKVIHHSNDFFNVQPRKDVTVFMVRQILHDWPEEYCAKILKHLRSAAGPNTTLLVLDRILPHACQSPEDDEAIPGAIPREAPAPLIANYGTANDMVFMIDIIMCLMFNSQERTIHQFNRLSTSTGWRLTTVNRQLGDSAYTQAMKPIAV